MAILLRHCPRAALEGMVMTRRRQRAPGRGGLCTTSRDASGKKGVDAGGNLRCGAQRQPRKRGYSCAKPGRTSRDCKGGGKGARLTACHLCGKEGHAAMACPGQQPAGASQIEVIW